MKLSHCCMIFLLATGISSCGSSGSSDSETSPAETEGSNPTPETPTPETPAPETPTDVTRPNVLLIISDDQGIDASAQFSVSADIPDTPNLNALAESGLVFENAWATPACTTTRGSIITGQHGVNSGIDRVPDFMSTDTLTLQRYLQQNGSIDTAVIGKWHLTGGDSSLSSHPTDSGVGYYAGNIAGTIDDYSSWPLTLDGQISTVTEYHTTQITNLAIDWISDRDQPWFMWLAYVAPHSPFHLPPAELHNRSSLSGDAADIDANPRPYYLAAIEAMDTEIGRLLDSMSQAERDNTLVVFIGDNGTPARVIDTQVYARNHSKSSLYEGGIRVPMIVSGAGVTQQNQRTSAMVNTTDLYSTVTDAFGLDTSTAVDGVSFYPLLDGQESTVRDYNYSEFVGSGNRTTGWTVRNERYKLIEYSDGSQELFDLSTDSAENNNLIESGAADADVIAALQTFGESIRQGR